METTKEKQPSNRMQQVTLPRKRSAKVQQLLGLQQAQMR